MAETYNSTNIYNAGLTYNGEGLGGTGGAAPSTAGVGGAAATETLLGAASASDDTSGDAAITEGG